MYFCWHIWYLVKDDWIDDCLLRDSLIHVPWAMPYWKLICIKWGLFSIEVTIEYYESIIIAYSLLDLLFMCVVWRDEVIMTFLKYSIILYIVMFIWINFFYWKLICFFFFLMALFVNVYEYGVVIKKIYILKFWNNIHKQMSFKKKKKKNQSLSHCLFQHRALLLTFGNKKSI